MSEEIIKYLEKVAKEKSIIPLDNYIQGLLDLYNKEKEKNKKAIDFINERKKTVNKDMAEGTRLQVGTFMWQVDELLEILKGDK